MNVELLNYTPLQVAARAIRTCWQSQDKSDNGGEKDKELINRVGNKHKHKSMLEILQYHFDIVGISLSCSHQLVRHRAFTFAQKSTRYTLKKILSTTVNYNDLCVMEYLNERQKYFLEQQIDSLLSIVKEGGSNDELKYLLPSAWKTQIVVRADGRNLQNFFELRNSSHAHPEIRNLATAIFEALPEDHKYLFEGCLK